MIVYISSLRSISFLAWQILQMTPKKRVQFLGYRVINTMSCYFHYIFSNFDVNEKKIVVIEVTIMSILYIDQTNLL